MENRRFGNIDLTPSVMRRPRGIRGDKTSSLIVVEGTGDTKLVFPPKPLILAEAIKRATVIANKLVAQARRQNRAALRRQQSKQQGKQTPTQPGTGTSSGGTPRQSEPTLEPAANQFCVAPSQADGDPTMWVVAQGVLDVLNARKWEFYVARFDEISGAYNSARLSIKDGRMDKILLWVVESLDSHVVQLRGIYSYVLPRAVTALEAAHPELPSEALAYCVAEALDEMFSNINQVVSLYASAFRQEMDGLYPVLDGLRVFLESTYRLFETGDPTGCKECVPALGNRVFRAGSRFLLLCGNDGPATISGGQELLKGPIGVHLGLVNLNELPMLLFELPVVGHENYHNIYWDVDGLPEETEEKVVENVEKWNKEGKFNFSTDHVMLGKHAVPILPLLLSIIVQQLPEIVADLPGGVCFTGGAYWKSIFQLFVALNSSRRGVLNTKEGLRTGSVFELAANKDGSVQLVFETHTPDQARALLLAEAYDAIGFPEDSAQCRQYANQANSWQCPEFMEWVDSNGQVDWTIRVRTSDFLQLFRPVVEAVLFEQMDSLGGLSNTQIVSWTQGRETKVQILVKLLLELFFSGTATFPDDLGDVYPHYLGAALTHVLWELAGKGWKPIEIFNRLNQPALALLLDLAAKTEAKAAAEAQASAAGDNGEQSPQG
jgi:hypothetical protein